jgi:hypothetical protein
MGGDGRPHWLSRFHEDDWPAFESFPVFLAQVWHHLGLPEPTEAQYEIAHRLQHGADSVELELMTEAEALAILNAPREDIIRAFRGIGKSYITAAFVLWRLMRNPRDEKVLVVSATSSKATEFVDQVKALIETMPLLSFLRGGKRDQAWRFDVAGASNSQSHSVKAVGIFGQTTGSRATCIVADDIEIKDNSRTPEARQRLVDATRDFDAIAKTEHGKGDQFFLGTPQTEESIYNTKVRDQGFSCYTIPARWPTPEKRKGYEIKREDGTKIDILAEYLKAKSARGVLRPGQITDARFGDEELAKQEAKGKSFFALQYQLDTSLSDAERYPLKLSDLVVMPIGPHKAPIVVQWGRDKDRRNARDDLPNLGFTGDQWWGPLFIDPEWRPYAGRVLYCDPAGRGGDELAWAIVYELNGTLYLPRVHGIAGDPEKAMQQMAEEAKAHQVNVIEIEPNFGQGMFSAAFQPILQKVWPGDKKLERLVRAEGGGFTRQVLGQAGGCTILESEWAKGQKEARILDTLEPVVTTHRLVVSEEVAQDETLCYQWTRLTRERNSLSHDDRIDAVAGAVAHFMRSMEGDQLQAAAEQLAHEKDAQVEEFLQLVDEANVSVAQFGRSLSSRVMKSRQGGTAIQVVF